MGAVIVACLKMHCTLCTDLHRFETGIVAKVVQNACTVGPGRWPVPVVWSVSGGIAAKARTSFRVLPKILEVQHPSGGAVLCRWKDTKDSGAVLE